jgi:hypothetical protein
MQNISARHNHANVALTILQPTVKLTIHFATVMSDRPTSSKGATTSLVCQNLSTSPSHLHIPITYDPHQAITSEHVTVSKHDLHR